LPLVLHWPLHAVQQQPAQTTTGRAVHSDIGESGHNTAPLE